MAMQVDHGDRRVGHRDLQGLAQGVTRGRVDGVAYPGAVQYDGQTVAVPPESDRLGGGTGRASSLKQRCGSSSVARNTPLA
ncbi:hypothetical protein SAZ11_60295 [Streptomyces sp. FXJ1.4098]|nr:hypothetical protein [Streptomyces sp. FXJ1.4098]